MIRKFEVPAKRLLRAWVSQIPGCPIEKIEKLAVQAKEVEDAIDKAFELEEVRAKKEHDKRIEAIRQEHSGVLLGDPLLGDYDY